MRENARIYREEFDTIICDQATTELIITNMRAQGRRQFGAQFAFLFEKS